MEAVNPTRIASEKKKSSELEEMKDQVTSLDSDSDSDHNYGFDDDECKKVEDDDEYEEDEVKVLPNGDALDSFSSEKKKSSELEEMKDQATSLVSVPKKVEDDEVKVFPNKGKGSGARMFWGTDDDDDDDSSYYTSGSDDEYTYTEKSKSKWSGMDDPEGSEYKLVRPPCPAYACIGLLKAVGKEKELALAFCRKKAELALDEYKRQKGVDYEFVKSAELRMTSLDPKADPVDDLSFYGMHMNFWAKLEGLDSSPELFFASLRDDEFHCCKLSCDATIEDAATLKGIQHCEHIKCLECDLWIVKEV